MIRCCMTASLLATLYLSCFVIFQQAQSIHGASLPSAVPVLSEECSFIISDNAVADKCKSFLGEENKSPVILISLDGFRPEYLNRSRLHDTKNKAAPTLTCLAQKGVSAPYMVPSYPTITFPNHYSIVTGLYPESHQIIANNFFDPDLNATFDIRKPDGVDPKWWKNGEPLWTTVRKQGKVSATYFWPGSDVTFPAEEERTPNYFLKYNKSASFQSRVDQVLEWMDLPIDKRPIFTTLYFEEPDSTGHKAGPNTPNVTEKLEVVDNSIRRLVDGLVSRGIFNCIDLIIVSDHGMADAPSGERLVNLEQFVPDLEDKSISFYGPIVTIRLKNTTIESEKNLSEALACKDSHMRVFNKWELPYRMHFSHSNRIPNVIVDLDVTWRGIFGKDAYSGGGAHGWDNLFKDMQAIFMGHGPSFKKNTVVRPFENVQLYNLICALVNVTPVANNGTWGALHHLLINPPAVSDMKSNRDVQEMPPILHMPDNVFRGSEVHITVCGSLKNEALLDEFSEEFINVNTTQEREVESLLNHAPLGVPSVTLNYGSPTTINLLVNEDYLIGFDKELGMPVWTSYTISNLSLDGNENENDDGQWIQDPRFTEKDRIEYCERIGSESNSSEVHLNHLFPKEFAGRKADAWLSTNVLEAPSHMTPVIKTMTRLLMKASATHENLNIISGPTRHHSPALFYVVSTCLDPERNSNNTCPIEYRELQAFLLPIRQRLNAACLTNEEFITLNVASLKDVERVTDLNFFTHLSIEEKTDLLTRTIADSKLVVQAARS